MKKNNFQTASQSVFADVSGKMSSITLQFVSCLVVFGILVTVILINQRSPESESVNGDEEEQHCSYAQYSIRESHLNFFQDDPVCCGKEMFYLGTGSEFLKYFQDCGVEPKNESMSIWDSNWTLYECLIIKALGPNQLTQESYVNLLAKNLPQSTRSEILSIIATEHKNTLVTSGHGNEQLQSIKTYWSNYFEAEHEVCTGLTQLPENSTRLKIKKDPSDSCGNARFPKMFYLPVTYSNVSRCIDSFVEIHGGIKINSSTPFKAIMYPSCALFLSDLLSEGDLKSTLNYTSLASKIIPKFYSKSIKTQILTMFLRNSRAKYSLGESDGVQEIARKIMQSKEAMLGDASGTDKKDLYSNICTISALFQQLFIPVGTVNDLPRCSK